MKKILNISAAWLIVMAFLVLSSAKCTAQAYVGIGAGLSSKAPVIELQVGVESDWIQVQGGFLSHLSNKVDEGASFYGKLSPVFRLGEYKIMPGFGYSHNLKSNDRKYLNSNTPLFSLYGYKDFGEGEFFLGCNYVDKTTFVTIGLRYLFQ